MGNELMDLWVMVEVAWRGKGFLEDGKRVYVVLRSVMLCKRGVPLAKWVGKERKLILK